MVASQSERELALGSMPAHSLGDGLGDARNGARVEEFADGRIVGDGELLELVVPVKVDVPSELLQLVDEAGFDEMDGTIVHADFLLPENERSGPGAIYG